MMWIGTHGVGLLLLVATVFGSGAAVRRLLQPDSLGLSWRPLANLCWGLALWTTVAFALAAGQRLALGPVLFCLGGVLLLGLWLRTRRPAAVADGAKTSPRATPLHRGFLALLGLFVLAPLAVLSLIPTVSWDASAYHLTVPRLFLEHGGFRPVELNVYSNWPLGTEMLFALAMLVQDYVLAKLVHFAFGVGVLYAMWVGLRETPDSDLSPSQRQLAGLLAMVFFLANGVVLFEMRVAYVDLAHGFYLTAAFLFLRLWRQAPENRAGLLAAGLCCGLMAATKLNGFVGIAALGWLLAPGFNALRRLRGWATASRHLALYFAAPVALLWGPWLVKSAWFTGNPVYPLLHGIFGGPDWSPELARQLSQWQQGIGMGREPLDFLLLPWRLVVHGGNGYAHFDGELGLFWLAVLPLALWASRRAIALRPLLLVAVTYGALWAMTSQQMRLLIPALPLLAMAGGHAVVAACTGHGARHPKGLSAVLAGVALGGLLLAHYPLLGNSLGAAQRMLVMPASDMVKTAQPPIFSDVDALPRDAKLLMLNTNQGFFCRREMLADSFFEASQISHWLAPEPSPRDVHGSLRQRQVSHVLLDRQPRPVTYPSALTSMLQDPGLVKPVAQSPNGRFLLFALK